MNSDSLAGKWKQLKGDVKANWGKLTDDDLDVIDGNKDSLVGKLQELYGDTKEAVSDKVEAWWKSAKEGFADAKEKLDELGHDLKHKAAQVSDDAKHKAAQVSDDAKHKVDQLSDKATNALDNKPS